LSSNILFVVLGKFPEIFIKKLTKMRNKTSLFVFFLLIKSSVLFSQVAINADGSNANSSALLDLKSNNKGLLPPRMTHVDMSLIPNPADGLIVYCTDCGEDGNGVLSIFMGGDWKTLTSNCLKPLAPTIKQSVPFTTTIVWDWQGVPYATGYKWNSTNDFASSIQMDTMTTKTETGLACNTAYTRYVWAYNSCGNSVPSTMSQTTLTCSVPTLTTTAASSIGTATATSGGYIIGDGGSPVTTRGVCWGTSPNPTIANSKTTDGAGMGIFVSSLTGLTDNTTYYLRAYATNSNGTGYGNGIMIKTLANTSGINFNPNLTYGTVTDIDGNVYKTITIGTQTWMAENLRTTKYSNGDPITNETGNWTDLETGVYCWYSNNETQYKAIYGALYNWFAVADSRNIAPSGWHVASDAEWGTLIDYLGGTSLSGDKLKEIGLSHWLAPNTGATNSSGFTVLPGGYRSYGDGSFFSLGSYSFYWTNTAENAVYMWTYYLDNSNADVNRTSWAKNFGFSVRCVKD